MPLRHSDELVTREELAQWLVVDVKTLDTWAAQGIGPPRIRVGPKAIRYRRHAVERWLADSTQVVA